MDSSKKYSEVCYFLIRSLSDSGYNIPSQDFCIQQRKYLNIISNLIKNLRNSKSTSEDVVNLIDADKKIKILVMEILKDLDIIEKKENKIGFNQDKIRDHNVLLEKEGTKVQELYKNIIEKLVAQRSAGDD